jgi:hypothetical protein
MKLKLKGRERGRSDEKMRHAARLCKKAVRVQTVFEIWQPAGKKAENGRYIFKNTHSQSQMAKVI